MKNTYFRNAFFALITIFFVSLSAAQAQSSNVPELPRTWLDTTYVVPSGSTIQVPAGGNFQAALDAARSGDVIELAAGATFVGNFVLPNKTGSEWIIICSSAVSRRRKVSRLFRETDNQFRQWPQAHERFAGLP